MDLSNQRSLTKSDYTIPKTLTPSDNRVEQYPPLPAVNASVTILVKLAGVYTDSYPGSHTEVRATGQEPGYEASIYTGERMPEHKKHILRKEILKKVLLLNMLGIQVTQLTWGSCNVYINRRRKPLEEKGVSRMLL